MITPSRPPLLRARSLCSIRSRTAGLLASLGLVASLGLGGACSTSDPGRDTGGGSDGALLADEGPGSDRTVRRDRTAGDPGETPDALDTDGPGPSDGPISDGPPPDVAPTLDFSCLGSNTPPAPTTATVSRLIGVLSPSSMAPVPNVAIELLDRQNQSVGASGTTDENGTVTLEVPAGASGFEGSIRMQAAGFLETYGVTDVPLTGPGANVLLLVTPTERDAVAALAGVTLSADSSVAIVLASDCVGNAIPGAVISVDTADAPVVYVDENTMPDPDATAAFSNGLALIGQLPEGPVTVTMRAPIEEGGQPQLIGTLSFTARNGTLAEGLIQPD